MQAESCYQLARAFHVQVNISHSDIIIMMSLMMTSSYRVIMIKHSSITIKPHSLQEEVMFCRTLALDRCTSLAVTPLM